MCSLLPLSSTNPSFAFFYLAPSTRLPVLRLVQLHWLCCGMKEAGRGALGCLSRGDHGGGGARTARHRIPTVAQFFFAWEDFWYLLSLRMSAFSVSLLWCNSSAVSLRIFYMYEKQVPPVNLKLFHQSSGILMSRCLTQEHLVEERSYAGSLLSGLIDGVPGCGRLAKTNATGKLRCC